MSPQFSDNFLWGAATAAHQIEGGNVNNDWWEREHADPPVVPESSGDACDSYHRYEEDLDLLVELGLNAYRFSLEWSRIEPAEGEFSRASVDHYRRVVEACLVRGLTPMVTLHHFTIPLWFQRAGGWRAPNAADLFGRYCERDLPVIETEVPWVCTINEPNLMAVLSPILERGTTPKSFPSEPDHALGEALLVSHRQAKDVLSSVSGVRSGYTVACFNFHPVGEVVPEWIPRAADWYLEQAADDDFLGVQCYSRILLGPDGPLEPDPSAELTSIGTEYYPDCVAETVTRAWELSRRTPLIVTENGIPTDDDEQRGRYVREAIAGLARAMADGVDVGGYLHWSLIDNFEWIWGFGPKYGLAALDRQTFARTLKPSARVFADIVRRARI